jgi:hypothetical protein
MPKARLADFAYIYLFYFSDYVVLAQWRANERANEVAQVLIDRNLPNESGDSKGVTGARRVLAAMLRNAEVGIFAIRYDEDAIVRQRTELH